MKLADSEQAMRWAVFPLLAIMFAVQVYACRGIYADGANFLLHLLVNRDFPWYDWHRIFNHFVTKGPTLLLMKCGVHNLVFLRYFFSAWILFCPLVVWGCTLWLLRRDALYWPFVMLFSLAYYGVNFFAVGEYNLCIALAGFCFATFVQSAPPTVWQRRAVFAAALLMSFNYPSAMFLGALLCVIAITKKEWVLAGLFAAAACTGLWEVLAPRDAHAFTVAKSTYLLWRNPQFWAVTAYSILFGVLYFARQVWQRNLCLLLCGLLMLVMIHDPSRLYPAMQHAMRTYVGLAFVMLMAAVWFFRSKFVQTKSGFMPALAAFSLLALLSMFDMLSSVAYARYVQTFRSIVNVHSGLLPYEASGLAYVADNERFFWVWAQPVMSVLLRDASDKAIILNPEQYSGYQPFDPHTAIPDLERYYR